MAQQALPQYFRKAYQDFSKGLNTLDSALIVPANQFTQLDNALINNRSILEKSQGYIKDASPFPNAANSFIRMLANYKQGTSVDNLIVAAQDDGNANTTYKVDIKMTIGDGNYNYIGYTTGTATFTNASQNVTGSGTTWSTNLKAGDKIKPNTYSNWYEVQSVTDNTHLVLTANYTDTTITDNYMARIILHKDYIPVGTTFNDNFIISNGIDKMMSFNNTTLTCMQDTNAPHAKFICKHKNRIFAANTSSLPSRLYWSHVNDETTWDPASLEDIFPKDSGNISGIRSFADSLIVFKDNGRIYQVVGEFDQDAVGAPAFIRRIDTNDNIGIITGTSAVVHDNNLLYFLAETGVYTIDPSMRITKMSWDINPTVQGLTIRTTPAATALYTYDTQAQWNTGTFDGTYVDANGTLHSTFTELDITDDQAVGYNPSGSSHDSKNSSAVAIDSNNIGHVFYTPTADFKTLKYIQWSADGATQTTETVTTTTSAITYIAAATTATTVAIIYLLADDSVHFTERSGGVWSAPISVDTPPSSPSAAPSIIYNGTDIMAAYGSGGTQRFLSRLSGVWRASTVTAGNPNPLFTSAVQVQGGNPRVMFNHGNGALYCYKNDTSPYTGAWTGVGSPPGSNGTAVSLILDENGKLKTAYTGASGNIINIKNWTDNTTAAITTNNTDNPVKLVGYVRNGGVDYIHYTYGNTGNVERYISGAPSLGVSPTISDTSMCYPAIYGTTWQASNNYMANNSNTIISAIWGANANELIVRRLSFTGTWTGPIEHQAGTTQWGTYEVINPASNGNTISYQVSVATSSPPSPFVSITPGNIVSSDSTKNYFQTKITFTLGQLTQSTIDSVVVNLATSGASGAYPVGFSYNNELYLSATTSAAAANNIVLFLDRRQAWGDRLLSLTSMARFKTKIYAGSSTNGDVYILNQGYNNNGAAYTLTATSKEDLLGSLELTKDIYKVYVIYENKPSGKFTFSYRLDNYKNSNNATWTDTPVDQTKNGVVEIPIGNTASSIQFKITSSDLDAQLGVIGWIVLYGYLGLR